MISQTTNGTRTHRRRPAPGLPLRPEVREARAGRGGQGHQVGGQRGGGA